MWYKREGVGGKCWTHFYAVGLALQPQETGDPRGAPAHGTAKPWEMNGQSDPETRLPSTVQSTVTWLLSQNIHLGRDKEIAGLNLLFAIF